MVGVRTRETRGPGTVVIEVARTRFRARFGSLLHFQFIFASLAVHCRHVALLSVQTFWAQDGRGLFSVSVVVAPFAVNETAECRSSLPV